MADDLEQDEEQQTEDEVTEEGSSKKLYISIAAVVVVLLIAGAGAWFWFASGSDDDDKKVTMVKSQETLSEPEIVPQGFDDEDEYDEDEIPLGAIYPLETFVVNLAGGSRFLRIEIQLEFEDREVPRRFYGRLVPVRDLLIKLLTSRPAEELSSSDGKEELKEAIKIAVNQVLRKDLVKKVYYTQFIIQ